MANAHHAGTVAQSDIGHQQRRYFADTQPSLQHYLDQRIVARGETVGRSPGRAQQRVDFGIGQAGWLAVAHRAHRPELVDDIAAQRAGAACPSAQAAQGIEPPVDRGGAPSGGDHVLAVGDQVVRGEVVERERVRLDRGVPGEEVPQIVAVAA